MPQPSLNSVHVNVPLTNISIAYIQNAQNFIADKVFPNIPVQQQSNRYYVYSKEDFFRIEAQERAPGTQSAGGGFKLDNTPTYFCHPYSVHKDIDDMIRANADAVLNMDRDATEWVTQQLLMKREKIWTSTYFKTTVWGTDLTGVSSGPSTNQFLQWDQTNSTPIEDITGAGIVMAEKTGYKPNTLVLSPYVFNTLKSHADVLDRIKYTQKGVVTTDILAGLFEVDNVYIPYGTENTSAEGATAAYSFMYGKGALLMYVNPAASLMKPSAGYTFSWQGYLGAGAAGNRIKRFRMEEVEADRVEGTMAFDSKLVCSDLGVYFTSAIA